MKLLSMCQQLCLPGVEDVFRLSVCVSVRSWKLQKSTDQPGLFAAGSTQAWCYCCDLV